MTTSIRRAYFLSASVSLMMATLVFGQESDQTLLLGFDKRRLMLPTDLAIIPERKKAASNLLDRLPQVTIEYDDITLAPSWISSASGYLTRGHTEHEIQPVTIPTLRKGTSEKDSLQLIKEFLNQNNSLFGHGAEILTNAIIVREFTTSHNGLKSMVWQQQVDGIGVFRAYLIGHITRDGELVSISSHFLPDPESAANLERSKRFTLISSPPISAKQAVATAATNIGEALSAESIVEVGGSPIGAERQQRFSAQGLVGEARVGLMWLPMNRNSIRLSWNVHLTGQSHEAAFRIIIDASSGEILVRNCLTDHISPATYMVFTNGSPSPFSPGNQTPSSYQPPTVNRASITLPALSIIASPNGWINDGSNETLGNNVHAHLDRDDNDQPDLPRPNGGSYPDGSPRREFLHALDFTVTDPPMAYGNAAVVNAFYWCNWFHDKLYELGFTEAAGNFQTDNFGRGGLGNDAVQADVQIGRTPLHGQPLFNSAGFTFAPDGNAGRLRLRVFDGATPDRDSAFDTEIILHELSHGHCQRSVGAGQEFSSYAIQSRGLKEGWGDFYALALLSKPNTDVNAKYPFAGYSMYQYRGWGFTQNYYFGIRRYPYTTDMGEMVLPTI